MRSLKAHYFLAFAVLGNTQPFLPLFLEGRGLDRAQVGFVLAASSVAILVTPVIIGFLADSRFDPRRLLAAIYILGGATAVALGFVQGFWPVMVVATLHALAFMPTLSLQDGMYFRLQRHMASRGQSPEPYHRIRLWGTIGFIFPGVLLFVLLRAGMSMSAVMFSAAACCVVGAINTLLLPEGCAAEPTPAPATPATPLKPPPTGTPTLAAARALLRPDVLAFCASTFVSLIAISAYYAFYPAYLTHRAGLGREWAGLIAGVGVTVEIFFMLGYGRMERRWGVRRLLILGLLATALRMFVLAASGSIFAAVGTQALHGMMVLVVHVLPAVYLNRRAQDHYRTSMQALYAMLISGVARIVGNALAGQVATVSLEAVFIYGGSLALLAAAIAAVAFREVPREPEAPAAKAG